MERFGKSIFHPEKSILNLSHQSFITRPMPTVKFTYALKRFFPQLKETPIESDTLSGLLNSIDQKYPGIQNYIVDEKGSLRKHVNIFIDGELIKDRAHLTDTFSNNSEVFIMQALSGG